ncbi:GTPase [Halobacterium noricense]|uniref:GTPase n=1 Tax=Halobacterium noricense TaxID=223182 RepID=UPI001E5C1A70|nr:GTPase [Halobacterium noricense]UHH24724.1 GTPase [Halobacterium noricense]
MRRVVIVGALGRDFHDFLTVFRDSRDHRVVAFTAAPSQNLGETGDHHATFPAELAGPDHPDGIPIVPESELEAVVDEYAADEVVFSYSDVSHEKVMHVASRALAAGADFRVVGPDEMQLDADVPVLAVDAVRTGCGKSQVSRALTAELESRGYDVAVVREPMPYGDLTEKRVERFADESDLADLTIEEREEYEQHVERGHVVYAGVDYAAIVERASAEADVIVWDGGNNELPFVRPDLHVVLADPLRAGDELTSHPGEANVRDADVVVVNKENSASDDQIRTVVENVRDVNPDAEILHADSVVTVDDPDAVHGKDALVVEDGPSLTHGGTDYGAGTVAAERYDATRLDPREEAVGSIADTLEKYDHLDRLLPAMGYTDEQIADLEATIRNVDPEVVVAGTPHSLSDYVDVDAPIVQVDYHVEFHDTTVADFLDAHADDLGL